MKNSLYNTNYVDLTKERIFFGTGRNTQRFDIMKYKWFDKSNDIQQGQDWVWDEITIKKDIYEHEHVLTDTQRRVIKLGLQRAIFLDSLNGRGPVLMFGQVTTLPELEAVITTWQHFEVNKHSKTYTKHLRAFYPNPDEIFNESFTIPELVNIATSVSTVYDRCYKSIITYLYKNIMNRVITEDEWDMIYTDFIMAWVEVNILEGIRFYSFFTSVWAINKPNKVMNELSSDLKFIARDENEHLNLTQMVLKIFKRNEEEGFSKKFKELMPRIKERFYTAYKEETEWCNFLLGDESYLGMNKTILKNYINYLINLRMKAIGLTPDSNRLDNKIITEHPVKWVEEYIHYDDEEALPQQENVLNYISNSIDDDVVEHRDLECVKLLLKDIEEQYHGV